MTPEAWKEQAARIIDPASWAVMDSYLKQMLRKYKGQNIGYDPEAFKHKESMAIAAALWPLVQQAIAQLRDRVAGLEEGLEVLRREATILCQNSMACAANHYGVDFSIFGMPGWLADSQARIEKAAALLTQNEVG